MTEMFHFFSLSRFDTDKALVLNTGDNMVGKSTFGHPDNVVLARVIDSMKSILMPRRSGKYVSTEALANQPESSGVRTECMEASAIRTESMDVPAIE